MEFVRFFVVVFFFNDTATTEIYTLSLHDALPIWIWVAGYVVRDPARVPSSWRSRRSLDDELREQGVVGISGIDTRALTRHLRERGAMRVGISSGTTDVEGLLARVKGSAEMKGTELADEVSTT